MNRLLKLLVVVAAVVFLAPPALAFVAVLLGLTIGLAAVALKVGVVVLLAYLAVMLLKALFGGPQRTTPQPISARESAIDDAFDDLKRREDAHLAELDRELARATRSTV